MQEFDPEQTDPICFATDQTSHKEATAMMQAYTAKGSSEYQTVRQTRVDEHIHSEADSSQ